MHSSCSQVLLKAFLVAIAITVNLSHAALDSGVYDVLRSKYHGVTFLEIGYFFLDSTSWVYTTATFTNFTDPLVFLSLPEIPGDTHRDGYPAIPRLRHVEREVLGVDFSVTTFESKIFLANSSFCVKTWYTPVPIDPPLPIVWMVIERGAWSLDGDQFFANSGEIYRLDETYSEYNFPKIFNVQYPNGDYAGFSNAVDVGAVTQLQTLLYDRFMLIRGRTIFRNAVRLLLVPHDTTEASYYRLINPNETVAFLLFKSGYVITCKEKLTLESRRYFLEINEVKRVITFQNVYLRPPGVFGLIQSTLGQDAVGLRVFDRTNSTSSFITQEDQCVTEDTTHTTLETVAVIVVGQVAFTSELVCNVVFDNPRPTSFPTALPTLKPTSSPTASPSTAAPSFAPTAEPTVAPTAEPTASPTALPTAQPSFRPTAVPTTAPTAVPSVTPTTGTPTAAPSFTPTFTPTTAEPTVAPTREAANHTDVVLMMRGNFGTLWGGPKLFVVSASNSSLFTDEPDLVENPKVRTFLPREGGIYVFTAGFENPPLDIDEHDLSCKMYWSVTVLNITSNSSIIFEGTYNSTLALYYDYTMALWSVQFQENMLQNGYVPCVPSSAPTALPTFSPTAIPTVPPTAVPTHTPSAAPTANPTASPTPVPTNDPTLAPTPVPTAAPTLAPTKANNTNVDLHLRASYGDSWAGAELFIQSGDAHTYYRRAPNTANGNPLNDQFLPMSSGIYVVSAVLPPDVNAGSTTDADFKCMIYWEFNIGRSGQLYLGTYNTTLVFQYDYFKDSWVLLYAENLITRYRPCFPSAAPTFRPTREPTKSPTRPPTFQPSMRPTRRPTRFPTLFPTNFPTAIPTFKPTPFPTNHPTFNPTRSPTFAPTNRPTFAPTRFPTRSPTLSPTSFPTAHPTLRPTDYPTGVPSLAPTYNASNVEITMITSYAEDWSGVEMIVTGPDGLVRFSHPGPEHGFGTKIVDFFPEGDGNYTFEARYPRWEPDYTDRQSLRCQVYFKLNFSDEFLDLVIHGTYETSVTLFYDWTSDEWTLIAEKGTLEAYDPCTPTPNPTVSPTMFNGNGGTYDMIANRYVQQPWMEIGYTQLDSRNWVTITGSFTNFYDPVVFLSVPNIDGPTSNDGYPASPRLNNVVTTRTGTYYSEVTFDAKIYLTNSSYCSKEWYTPQHIDPPISVSWMIAERGAWNLSSRFFFVDKGPISRIDDSYFEYNMMRRENPYECDTFDAPCKFPDFIAVDNIGAITQIQTLVHDRFLLVRAYSLNRRQGMYLLTPHDSSDPSYYVMTDPETMAFMHFQGGVSITCRESITIETSLHRVTHFKERVRYNHNFTIPPGVFGMISSVIGQDSVGLRAFERTKNGVSFITQEDKCVDEETDHTSEELVSIFIAGAVAESTDFKCDIIHDYSRPSTFVDNGGTYDMIHKRYIDDIWLEIGFTNLDTSNWVYIETTFSNFTDPVVFLSLPDIGGETSNDGFPVIGRLRHVQVRRHDNNNATTSFQAKLFLANDSACSSQWYTPKHIWPPIPISWMVAERGAWNLSSNFFFVNRANIWREDQTYEDYNYITVNNPSGCVSKYIPCQFPEYITVARLGAITQLQSLVYDRFLLVRGFSINRRFGRYLLTPLDSSDPAYYEMWDSEVVGYLHYHDNVQLDCKEDLTIETAVFDRAVTNLKVLLPYRTLFNRPPGVFGQIMTTIGRDSVGLRAFNRTISGSFFITQEDQCFDEETDHTTPETVSLFIAGSLKRENSLDSNFTCNMKLTESKFIDNGGTFDLIRDKYATQPWMELGYTSLDTSYFVRISSSFTNFIEPVVFLSLPDIPGETSDQGYPAVGRVNNVVLNRTSSKYSVVTFDAKLYIANDTACSSEWYTPQILPAPVPIAWMIAEAGAWNLSDAFFFVSKGPITRDDETYETYNMKRLFNRPGCNPEDIYEPCAFPKYLSRDDLGMIAQLQTIVYNRFLLVRGFFITRKAGSYLLTPHDSMDLSYYVMLVPETLGYMHFNGGNSLTCREAITIETSLHRVNYLKQVITFAHNFTAPPAVFGLISSVIGQDSVGLRSFDRTLNNAAFITQEDQCVDEETKHTSQELVSILVTGTVFASSKVKCDFVLWAPITPNPTHSPSASPTLSPTTASPTSKPSTARPTLTSEFRTPYPSTLPEFVTNIPTDLNRFHTEIPTRPGQFETPVPTRTSQFNTNAPTTIDQFATNAPTINVQFHTEIPTTIEQFQTATPTTSWNFVTEGPTTVSQFRTSHPSDANALYTDAPTVTTQFVTRVPTPTAQYHTESPGYSGTLSPSRLSGFVTSGPTTVNQFSTHAPTSTNQFVTHNPTRTEQFLTDKPSALSNFYSHIPTVSAQFRTSIPTTAAQFSTAGPTSVDQFSTSAPTSPSAFLTNAPSPVAQYSTEAPTTASQFVTQVPSNAAQLLTDAPTNGFQFRTPVPTESAQFRTTAPTPSAAFLTNVPTRAEQFRTPQPSALTTQSVTSLPSAVEAFHTEAPSNTAQFTTRRPTTINEFHTEAPSNGLAFHTSVPTTTAQFRTSGPTSTSNFVTNAPTRSEQFITRSPTLVSQRITQRPTTTLSTSHPTLAAQYSTQVPSLAAQFHTEHPSRIEQFSTRSPTEINQFSTRAPTRVEQFSTNAPSPVDQFYTNTPTLISQYRADILSTRAPTTKAQFTTPAPTRSAQFHTAAPSTVLQWRTSQPSPTDGHVTNFPTIQAQFSTEGPTTVEQFHTSIPTKSVQFATNRPTTVNEFLTSAPTPSSQFSTHIPTLASEFSTSIPTKTYQYHTEHPTTSQQFPPHLREVGEPTYRPSGSTSTRIQFEAYTDIYNSNCEYWMSAAGQIVFKNGVIATQPTTPQPLHLDDIIITDCILIQVRRRSLRGIDETDRRVLQVAVPRVLWRIDTFLEYFGYTNGTQYFDHFKNNFMDAVSDGRFISAMQLADPTLVGITTGSSDTVFGPYEASSQSKSNDVVAESRKYFWPIFISTLFCFCCLLFLLFFICFRKRKEKEVIIVPTDTAADRVIIRETTLLTDDRTPVDLRNRQSARHQVKISAISVSSPTSSGGYGRVLTPGAAKSYKDYSGLPPYSASDPEMSEKLQTWILNLEQSNATYRENLDMDPREDEPSLTTLLTLPHLTNEQIDLLIDFAEELYADCESLFARVHGVLETHGSMKFGRIRQTKYSQAEESLMPSPPRPNNISSKKSNML